jgi:2-(1,2-epoxy-1,2-dihydrophenyl)acetyl-CoA isomerase
MTSASSAAPVGCPPVDLEHAYDTVNLYRRGAELRIELNRPHAMNAWDVQFGRDLGAAVERAAAEDVRAVVLTGAGRAFSSGADLKAGFEPTPEGHPDVLTPLRQLYHPIIAAVRSLPKPVIAAVNGPAVGIGCSLALACDLVIARESAYFLLAFANIGLIPDGGASIFVPERAGLARATEMAMLAERIPAPKALEWGLANRVVADDDFDAEVDALAARLAAGPTGAYARWKREVNAWLLARMPEQLDLEAVLQQEAAASEDFREGALAFLQRRPAEFRGR